MTSGVRVLVKFGGAAMDNPTICASVCAEMAALHRSGVELFVVHGGGKEISTWIKRVGLETNFIDGLRVTDDDTMAVTEMVLSGLEVPPAS